MDKIDKSISKSLSLAAEAIGETSSKILKIISGISEDLDKHEDQVKKESQAIKERVRSGARRTSGNLA